jgi:hypothetical protein
VRTLSKSDFVLARTCPTKLYYRELGYPQKEEDLSLFAESGYMVEALAKARRPDGIALSYGGDPVADSERTREYLRKDRVTLFEATILVGHKLARIDILEKDGSTLRLIEVKSKTFGARTEGEFSQKTWRPYFDDIAYQAALLDEFMAQSGIVSQWHITPCFLFLDQSKQAGIDGAQSRFELIYRTSSDGERRLSTARYVGPREDLEALDLLIEVDVRERVEELAKGIREDMARFESSIAPTLQKLPSILSSSCRDCEFRHSDGTTPDGFRECWGALADASPHVLELLNIGQLRGPTEQDLVQELAANGQSSLADALPYVLGRKRQGASAQRQRRQIETAQSGLPWFGPELRPALEGATYPLHFIDFETAAPAIPYYAGMSPYEKCAIQWSCHTVYEAGAEPIHSEWLNDVDSWPNARFARSLRACVGDAGTLVVWSHAERSVLEATRRQLPRFDDDGALDDWLDQQCKADRVLDLEKLTKSDFCHPGMHGSTSIKPVLSALWQSDPAMRAQFTAWTGLPADEATGPYAALPPVEIAGIPQDVHEGTGAMRAYQEMMYGEHRNDPAAKDGWSRLLRQYCQLDTLAMVLIWEYWRRNAPTA